MNIFHRITRQTLRKNRARTIVTVIGILLSTAMFTAVTTFISTVQNHLLRSNIDTFGDWYGCVRAASAGTAERIGSDARVTQLSSAQVLGYSPLETVQQEGKPYLYVLGADDTYFETMPVRVTQGRLPENDRELAIPEHLYLLGGIDLDIGDVITIPLSYRMLGGEALFQRSAYSQEETLQTRQERTFTIVGIVEEYRLEDYSSPGYTAFTRQTSDLPEDTVTDCYFKLARAGDTQAFLDELNVPGSSMNQDVLMYMGVSGYASFMATFIGLAVILIALIVFGSVSLIYNAFAISVSERTRQFGLLVSIGATKKQLRASVVYEALLLSLIGIPLGVLSGIAGIGVTLRLLSGVAFLDGMRVHASPLAIALAAAIALVTVLISAHIPAKRAMRVTAIDAIRQTADVQAQKGREPSYRLTYRLFGLPGLLAAKHFRRSRRRYRATIVSLFLSIVLFISASTFSHYLTRGVSGAFNQSDRDLLVNYAWTEGADERTPEEVLAFLRADGDVTQATCVYLREYGTLTVPAACLRPEAMEFSPDAAPDAAGNVRLSCCIYVIDDESFRTFLREQGLDETVFFDPAQPRALIGATAYLVDEAAARILEAQPFAAAPGSMQLELFDNAAFNALTPEEMERSYGSEFLYTVALHSGMVLDPLPYGLNGRDASGGSIALVYPAGNAPAGVRMGADDITYYLQTADHAAVAARLRDDALRREGFAPLSVLDYVDMNEQDRNVVLVMNVFAYGFIVLISLIAVANVFNTISTNIQLRRREFAMLKSVGMSRRGFRRMMNYECLLYGCKALLFGLPVSFAVTWLIFRSISNAYVSAFRPPLPPFAIAIGSVFLVVFVTMLYAMRRVERENPIDVLKNENL